MATRMTFFILFTAAICSADERQFHATAFEHNGFNRTVTEAQDGDVIIGRLYFDSNLATNSVTIARIEFFNNTPCAISHLVFKMVFAGSSVVGIAENKPFYVVSREIVMPLTTGTLAIPIEEHKFPFLAGKELSRLSRSGDVIPWPECSRFSIVSYTKP